MASVTMQISSLIDSRFDNFKKQFTEENSSSVEAAVKRAKRARFVFQSKGNEQQFEHAESRRAEKKVKDSKKKRSQKYQHQRFQPYPPFNPNHRSSLPTLDAHSNTGINCLIHCSVFSRSFISSDISKVGVWKEARKLSDPELSIQVPHLLDLVLASNAPSTTSKYSYGWARWRRWTQSKQGVSFMPAHPLCIALYLLELTEDALQKNSGCSAIDSALYGIRWAHKIAGLASPTEHPTVIAAAEGARRKLSKPVQPKQPLDLETVVKVAQYYNTALASLADIRFLFVFLVGYAGLFRISELLSVKIKDITIVHDSMSIFSLGISYSTIRDEFKKYVSPFVNDPSDYCLHSLKSGGASNDGYKLSDPELKDRHAGWKNPCTKRRYTKRSHSEMLEVTRSMGI
ncbi:unnamed protein product [Porites evermanni]|uniref:Tyr recombinase domain-containing protein n=2 Tax=Porites TaxID=46719 RepID=A0ABN8RN82_9CNID|nr:unnamed protein product [Porites lobata]CAH3196267.1 unnamed protein product [Porites evermanni]